MPYLKDNNVCYNNLVLYYVTLTLHPYGTCVGSSTLGQGFDTYNNASVGPAYVGSGETQMQTILHLQVSLPTKRPTLIDSQKDLRKSFELKNL